jgi:hypothetical protein
MASSKRTRHDENSFAFIDMSTPAPKRPRRTAQPVTLAEVRNLQQERAERDAKEAEDLKESIAKAAEERHLTESKLRVETVLRSITAAGYESLYGFIGELLNTRDQQLSARVSRMLGRHGDDILNSIRARQPDLVKQWTLKVSGEILAQEGQKLANYLRPAIDAQVSEILQSFSLERIMSDADTLAPTLCELLRHVATPQDSDPAGMRKDRSLVSCVSGYCF